ncbi:LytR/AlgR family response regulator transcription factor [Neolewinella antarctica]|uniref:DNA-binding LytR/AlgR family response regulator n=1 Tax=Neolewinella antarctica TaxID=442734 RepID=A0ABX0XHX5_9BACT|nr:LytTR family DNA-binding domain-containing protein [Neolewinella antarctica]NJC28489.1 DNA-binding LytR/AlgR family response regulator [Neolewinella antarctica]
MESYQCIIIEDEPLAMERTRDFVQKIPDLRLAATFDNALTGLQYLKENTVDILFLDINMDELSGVELLESTRITSQVIITTAFPDYALKGYELSVTDYLLKPFTFVRFLQAVEKARDQLAQPVITTDYLFVKTENRLEKILIPAILFIESMRDYRRIHTRDKRVMTLQTLTELERRLPAEKVCRVHRSYMVGLANIEAVERSRIVIGKERIPISDSYRAAFLKLINQA